MKRSSRSYLKIILFSFFAFIIVVGVFTLITKTRSQQPSSHNRFSITSSDPKIALMFLNTTNLETYSSLWNIFGKNGVGIYGSVPPQYATVSKIVFVYTDADKEVRDLYAGEQPSITYEAKQDGDNLVVSFSYLPLKKRDVFDTATIEQGISNALVRILYRLSHYNNYNESEITEVLSQMQSSKPYITINTSN